MRPLRDLPASSGGYREHRALQGASAILGRADQVARLVKDHAGERIPAGAGVHEAIQRALGPCSVRVGRQFEHATAHPHPAVWVAAGRRVASAAKRRRTPQVPGLVERQPARRILAIWGALPGEAMENCLRPLPVRQVQLISRAATVGAEQVVQAAATVEGAAEEISRFVKD